MQTVYSWCGTNIQLPLSEEAVASYNRVADAFANLASDTDFSQPVSMEIRKDDMLVWNKVADIINTLSEMNGGSLAYLDEDMPSNHFVKV